MCTSKNFSGIVVKLDIAETDGLKVRYPQWPGKRSCTLVRQISIRRCSYQRYKELSSFHYRAGNAPAVVTDVGSCAEVVDGAGLVVPPRDSVALADAILRMLEDHSLWQRCALSCREVASRYSWAKSAATVTHQLEQLLAAD